ncbi:hypothetical protein [Yinghuangia soli]|uniref:Uncharacterized protein n=1 Tax=Yinghuangia soli TaxID=2908204 RepID=A0AA41TY90_9ACTN|nr:hypothetical protein [Yinghuangia soli]MCF2526141.1 hypothetical protein [Yinghuangia soli]
MSVDATAPGRWMRSGELLDEVLALFAPNWTYPPEPPGFEPEHPLVRCNVKRTFLADVLLADLDGVREHADLLLLAAVHDTCPDGVRRLVDPLVAALGYRTVHDALIGYVRTGTPEQQEGARMAWYWAKPRPREIPRDGIWRTELPSRAVLEEFRAVGLEYRRACLKAGIAF